jgi:hypothetical protein
LKTVGLILGVGLVVVGIIGVIEVNNMSYDIPLEF